jgi:NADH-quinone oxidoreductase subunit L
VAAAKKAFIVNRIGDLGLALGIWLIFTKFGTVQYATLFADAQFQLYLNAALHGEFERVPWTVQLIPVLLAVGAFGKSAQFPLYVWLPDAMEGPTPVSALIHAATMVTAGVFLIARCIPIFQCSEYALPVVAWIGTITALLAATIGMAQFDIKRIMAYSTVSQLGFMFAGLGFLTSIGAASHVFTHAFFKALLFLACGAVMHGFAGQLDLRKLSGVQRMPGWRIVGFTMLIGCLNLAGFPLITAGFWSKDMIMAEGFVTHGPGFAFLASLLVLTAGLTAYYTFRVYFRVFVGPEHYEPGDEHHGPDIHDEHREHIPKTVAEQEEFAREAHQPTEAGGHHDHHGEFHPHAPGWAINTVLATLAILTFVAIPLVLIPKETHGWVGNMVHHSSADIGAAADAHGGAHGHAAGGFFSDPHQWMLLASSVVGIFGILVAAVLHGPRGAWSLGLGSRTEATRSRADDLLPKLGPIPRWAQHKWYVDEFYDYLIRRPLWVISHIFHWIDKLLVDGLVNLLGWLPRALGAWLRPAQSGQLHGYAVAMAGGIAVLILIVLVATW